LQNSNFDTELAVVELKKKIGFDWDAGKYTQELFIPKLVLVDVYDSLPKLTLPATFYREKAYEDRAILKKFTQLVKSSEAKYKSIDGNFYPSVYANGDYMVQDVDEDAFAPDNEWSATVSLEWNLYEGGKTDAQTQEAQIKIMEAKAELENTKLIVQKEVRDAYINVEKQLDGTKLTENLSRAAKEKYTQVEQRYEYGLADFVELQQARQDYINSLADLTKSYYAYYTSQAELDRAIGK
jgi:outer membrane protein